ncbi:MAG: prepilin-type N-terminal cleavage/methylation domain-containing protein [Candidatus Zambryskibacteria bacterium]|nr:prepilin-type N-terminal cleavage/methylation domain-containing protein [Candidatus Zambryskibacteria bacterium]
MTKDFRKQRGFSLVEMLIYISILAFMLVVIMNITVSLFRSERTIQSSRSIENSALTILERLVREIRQADSIDALSSVFDISPGALVLNGTDEFGNSRTIEFRLSSEAIVLKENGLDLGALSESNARVTSMVFHRFSGPDTFGIRAEITIESGTSTYYRTDDFYSSAILR